MEEKGFGKKAGASHKVERRLPRWEGWSVGHHLGRGKEKGGSMGRQHSWGKGKQRRDIPTKFGYSVALRQDKQQGCPLRVKDKREPVKEEGERL